MNEVSELIEQAEAVKQREQEMLKMFELAGYELIEEYDDGKGRPKTLIELLQEALGNPPENPGQWIRIADIPRFITENLQVPEDLKAFNDAAPTKKPKLGVANFPRRRQRDRHEVPDNDTSDLDLTHPEFGLKPRAPKGYQLDGKQYSSVAEVGEGQIVMNVAEVTYQKVGDDQWIMPRNELAGVFYDFDVDFAPLYGLVEDDE